MLEPSESNWEKHFLYGTSRLLQLLGPEWCMVGSNQECFLTLRIFEISRALIYNDSTFLAESKWIELTDTVRNNSNYLDHPKEELYDVMICCSSLRIR